MRADIGPNSVEIAIDDAAATMSSAAIAEFLQKSLGQRTAAALVGLGDPKQLGRYRRSNGPSPRPAVEMRMREAYKLVSMIADSFDNQVAKNWLLGTNSRLDDTSPIELFRAANSPQEFTPIRSAARQFVVSESTVRDPLADLEAVKEARKRPMSERLELALSWNRVAGQLRTGMEERAGSGS